MKEMKIRKHKVRKNVKILMSNKKKISETINAEYNRVELIRFATEINNEVKKLKDNRELLNTNWSSVKIYRFIKNNIDDYNLIKKNISVRNNIKARGVLYIVKEIKNGEYIVRIQHDIFILTDAYGLQFIKLQDWKKQSGYRWVLDGKGKTFCSDRLKLHRMIMGAKKSYIVVHHINGVKADLRKDNLIKLNRKDHSDIHNIKNTNIDIYNNAIRLIRGKDVNDIHKILKENFGCILKNKD